VPVRVALRVIADVLAALDYAHAKVDQFGRPMHIVHRDVNPRNVMLSVRGETKLIDFGVAKATGRLERTQTDHVKGKFAYMAPEQVTAKEHDHRADLFAVGLCLHELITGYSPFHGLNQVQIMHRLLSQRVPPLQTAPSEFTDGEYLKRVHRKALESDPALRYQSAGEFRRDVENLAAPLGGLASLEEMARFLRYVEPELTDALQRKMEEYAKPIDLSTTAPAAPIAQLEPGTMTGMSRMTNVGSGASNVTRAGAMLGGVFVGTFLAAGAFAMVALGVLLVWKWEALFGGGTAPPEPAPAAVVAPPEPESPAPAAPGTGEGAEPTDASVEDVDPASPGAAPAEPAEAPPSTEVGPTPGPGGGDVRRPGPGGAERVVTGAATAPPGGSDPAPADAPAAGTATAPVEAPPAEPPPKEVVVAEVVEPKEAAPTASGEVGTLQVTSMPRGLPIRVNGRDTGQVTPAQLEWPVGTVTVSVEGFADQQVTIRRNQRVPVLFK
jgi:serine/threonine-protein kinase